MGEGHRINWKVQCSFVSLHTGDETQGKRWLTALEMSERGLGTGGMQPWFLCTWHQGSGPCSALPRSTGQPDWLGRCCHLALPAGEALQVFWD